MSEPAETIKQEYTYADYLTWPDDERWEPTIFGDGEHAPVRMLPGLVIDLGRVFAEARRSESG